MKSEDVYDEPQKAEWAEMPAEDQFSVIAIQRVIQAAVEILNPGKFVPTSGWRGVAGNKACGGAARSRHLLGLARDFVSVDGVLGDPPIVPYCMRVVRSPRCWHVEMM